MEKLIEKLMYSSRWIMAPIYLGLSLVLLALGIKFFQEILHVFPHILEMKESDLVLVTLSLIDIALVGGLIVMVMFSGYENFVSRLDVDDDADKLGWLGKLDAGSLKNKVAASIVAISSIHLLKVFMNAQQINNDKIMWYLLLHITFVVSAFAMGYLDKINSQIKASWRRPLWRRRFSQPAGCASASPCSSPPNASSTAGTNLANSPAIMLKSASNCSAMVSVCTSSAFS